MYKIRFKNLAVEDKELKEELLQAVAEVLTHGIFILGAEVDKLENKLAEYCQRKYCIGVGSGTDAIYLALRALDIGAGSEVITTPLTWVATTNAIVLTGATPVFADISSDFNIDPATIEKLITAKTKAILPVNFTGQMCKMDKLQEIADKHNLYLVEDAAQSFGSFYHGDPSGSFGDISCFSINPMKNLSSYGEAGAILTNNPELAEKIASLRYAGTKNRQDCHYPSINGRIDTIQAAMILVNLKHLESKLSYIRKLTKTYDTELAGLTEIICPREAPATTHSYYSYTIMTEKRDQLQQFLDDKGIETKIQHPLLMPYHTAYKGRFKAEIPVAEQIVKKILCLPCHEKLHTDDIKFICRAVREFLAG